MYRDDYGIGARHPVRRAASEWAIEAAAWIIAAAVSLVAGCAILVVLA